MSTSVLDMPLERESFELINHIGIESQFETTSQSDAVSPSGGLQEAIEQSPFTSSEMESLQRDDAMASAMVAVILGCAFTVLLALTIGVTVWTMYFAG